MYKWIGALPALAAGAAGFAYYQNNALEITRLTLEAPVERTLTVVHLSDLHSKQYGRGNVRLIYHIRALAPDVVVFTGDLVDDSCKHLEETVGFLGKLAQGCPVVFVAGNHDHRGGRYREIRTRLQNKRVTVVDNSITTLHINGTRVHFLGLYAEQGSFESYRRMAKGQFEYPDHRPLLRQLEQLDGLKLVLCHFPENFALMGAYSYQNHRFDLMFSGHAHGGQFILPLVGGVLAPGQGFFPKYYRGVYGTSPKLVVSRGLGNSSFPLRLFNRPEIIAVTLTNKKIEQ